MAEHIAQNLKLIFEKLGKLDYLESLINKTLKIMVKTTDIGEVRASKGKYAKVVKSSRLPVKIIAYLVSNSRLLCLAFLYGWRFLNKISLDWPLTLTTQPSTSRLSDNPDMHSSSFDGLKATQAQKTKKNTRLKYLA